MRKSLLPLLASLAVSLGGCSAEDPASEIASSPCVLLPDEVEAIRDMETTHGAQILDGDLDARQADLAEDVVVVLPNRPPIVGRSAVREFRAGFPPMHDHEFQVEEIFGCGDMALARGTYSMVVSVEGEPEPMRDSGSWIHVLRKQPDGRWLIVRDMVSSHGPET